MKIFLVLLVVILLVIYVALFVIPQLYFKGADLSRYQQPRPEVMNPAIEPSAEHVALVASILNATSAESLQKEGEQARLQRMREAMDKLGDGVEFDGEIIPVDHQGIKGEWLIPVNADVSKRMLYIHGGAFIMGSPFSHRAITTRYAQMIGGPVFSLDYRLMPEHSRQAGIDDSRAAYRWILEHGPEGPATLNNLFVSGDSAGGNLVLALTNWVRDNHLPAPQAVVALSPATDSTFSGPSFNTNVESDAVLGRVLGPVTKFPRSFVLWYTALTSRTQPSNSNISPVFADLGDLPPTLVQVSASEMLLDDAVLYVNKARSAGSPVSIQVWDGLIHVWHIFVDTVPEAQDAFTEIDKFLKMHTAR